MTDLEYLSAEIAALLGQQPVFFRTLGVSNKQKTHHSVPHESDRAREVRVLETDRPG